MRNLLTLASLLMLVQTTVAQDDLSIVHAYLTDAPPTIDGIISPGEWDAAGLPIVVAPTDDIGTAFPDDPYGGPEDLSFQFRAMWAEPWTAYFLFEVTDDIAMEAMPGNRWEADQVEFFMDGDDLEGSDIVETYQWWDNSETYGKLGGTRFEGVYEGNTAIMSPFTDDLYEDGFGAFGAVFASESETNGNYLVEYAVSLEPMFDAGVFEDTITQDAEQIVVDETIVKWTACVSDDDNFGDGTTGRSHITCYYRATEGADWRDSSAFADLVFTGAYTPGTAGDYNANGQLDANDLDLQAEAIQSQDLAFDENDDGVVDVSDRQVWLNDYKNTWMGDADLNGVFDSSDFVSVFTAGKYETGDMAGWAEGDWDGNQKFDSSDFVGAFADGGYEMGTKPGGPQTAVAAVPEPSSFGLFLFGCLIIATVTRMKRR